MEDMNEKRIEEKLVKLDESLTTLNKLVPKTYEEYKKRGTGVKWELERGLQLISEVEIDIIVLLYKGLKKGIAGEEKSLLSDMSKELGEDVINAVKERRQLRNELVHAYTIDNDKEVFAKASDTSDVHKFEDVIRKFL
jgi:uncharacterized protein YutE (UPF0331/DUF86 family)